VSEHEAIRKADDDNVWVGAVELAERVQLLEDHIRVLEAELKRLAEPRETIDRLERELAEAKKEAEKVDVCWHCNCLLEPVLPHCDDCPSTDEGCDEDGCDEPGCVELDGCRLTPDA
jgi:hypothetical protein